MLAIIFVFGIPSSAMAGHFWGNSAGPYHWERSTNDSTATLADVAPRDVTVGNNHVTYSGKGKKNRTVSGYDEPWYTMLGDVVTDWDTVADPYPSLLNLTVTEVEGGTGNVESYNDEYRYNGWLGLASISINSSNHIVRAEVKVNDTYFNHPVYDSDIARRHVQCQEVGHIFGLDHNRIALDTCMNDTADALFLYNAQFPNAHDSEALNHVSAYGHFHYVPDTVDDPKPKPCRNPKKCAAGVGFARTFTEAIWAEHFDSVADMYDSSDLVADVTVLSSTFNHMDGRSDRAVPVTHVILEVNDVFSGYAGHTIVLTQTRGPNLEIVDDPGYVVGDTYTLYLRQNSANSYHVVNPVGRIRR